MNLRPLYEKIVIKLKNKQEIKSTSGLSYIQDMSLNNNTLMRGEVVAVGEGRLLANGELIPLKVKIGDIVLFSKMQGESYNDGADNYIILSEPNILAILQGGSDENN